MPVSDVLKSFRKGGYSPEKPTSEPAEATGGPRIITLTDEEAKTLGQGQPGGDVSLEVSGRLEGTSFTVMSVKPAGGGMPDEGAMAAEVMGKSPMMPPGQS